MDTTEAILLRRTKFSDTSLIVTWLTRDHGKLKTMCKGALRPKSPFAGRLDLFFEAEIGFTRSARSELHTLRELRVTAPRDGLRRDYLRVELAAYFVELLELMTEPEHPVPELYHLMQRALAYLETATPTRRALAHFETELARLLGILGEGSGGPPGQERNALPPESKKTIAHRAHNALLKVAHRLPEGRRGVWERLG